MSRPTTDDLWQAVIDRDTRFDGWYFSAVASTGIYCLPSCSSRRPLRRNVTFFDSPKAAEAAGYRACLRCRPKSASGEDPTTAAVAAACRYIEGQPERAPSLAELGAHVGLSASYLQRVFTRMVGISPRRYWDSLRVERFKTSVRAGDGIAAAQYSTGYGSSSRLYEAASRVLGMTPAAYRDGAPGLVIRHVTVKSPLGYLLVAATERGVCAVRLGDSVRELNAGLRDEFSGAELVEGDEELRGWVALLVAYLTGNGSELELPYDVRATSFQRQVWEAIRAIPLGSTATYGELAAAIGRPRAARAVARACAANPVALVVPCHRVVPAAGGTGGYRWGAARKARLLEMEKAAAE